MNTLPRLKFASMTSSLGVTLARAHVEVGRSRDLCEKLPPLCAQSRALVARSRELCRPYWRIRGANDVDAAPPARPMLAMQAEAIWSFLRDRRGEMFCTQCLSNELQAAKRIDRAVLTVEGRGARRQYGRCASCGKERLLCGLTR